MSLGWARTWRAGSLALGQQQGCYGGCFSPQYAFSGELANVRIFDRVLSQVRCLPRRGAASSPPQ